MSENYFAVVSSYEPEDCFGLFNKSNPLCTRHCALRLSCAVEKGQNLRTELIEELVASEDAIGRIQ
jgi:hypothetical protein